MSDNGVLLVHLGTPEEPTVPSVRRFLAEFLMDPEVITLPTWLRSLLVYGLVVPFRPYKIVKGYQAIWDPQRGSPLRYHAEDLTEGLSSWGAAQGVRITHAFRYGAPSIKSRMAELSGCQRIWVIPWYPQYARSTSESVRAAVVAAQKELGLKAELRWSPSFYQAPFFVQALAEQFQHHVVLSKAPTTHVIMSFHGLPEQHIKKTCRLPCGKNPCPIGAAQRMQRCYRGQCYGTARALAQAVGLSESAHTVAFQSRLGKAPWIKPYTQDLLPSLYQQGVRDLVVVCPSFLTDCLETLEEINLQLQETWHDLGGQGFQVVPSLNASLVWQKAVQQWLVNDVFAGHNAVPFLAIGQE